MGYKKNSSYAKRGMWLENIINDTNTYYLSKDIAIIYKKPTPIKVLNVSFRSKETTIIDKAVFSQASTLDYNGIYKGKYIEFDAKETKDKTSFKLSNIQNHQLTHIDNIIRHGGYAFLIIYMNNEFYLLNGVDLLLFIKNNERKSIPYSYIKEHAFKIQEKYIPRIDYIKELDKIIKE